MSFAIGELINISAMQPVTTTGERFVCCGRCAANLLSRQNRMGVNRELNAWQSERLQIADLSDLTYAGDIPVRVV